MLQEVIQHFGVVGDAFWYVTEDKQGKPLEIWPMHPALTRIVATKQGEVLGYVMRAPCQEPMIFSADEVLHFPLPNPTNDLYAQSPWSWYWKKPGLTCKRFVLTKPSSKKGMSPSTVQRRC